MKNIGYINTSKTKSWLTLIASVIFFSMLFVSCEKDEGIDFGGNFTESETMLDYSYGNEDKQTMDIYLPANRSAKQTHVLLLIHGGAWLSGDKSDMNAVVPILQQAFGNEYAIVNMNYRLVKPILGVQYMLPTQTDDIAKVMDFMEKNATGLGINPKFVTVGVSAGGHLSLLYSYKFDSKKRVKAIVNIVGPTDLSDSFYTNDPLFSLGLKFIMNSKNIPAGTTANEYASPINWVDSKSPPTISFYGNRDHLIPNNQSEKLENKLKSHNVKYEMYHFDGGHDIAEKNIEEIVQKSKSFLGQVK